MSEQESIPLEFGTEFLAWFRVRTEGGWAALPPSSRDRILADFVDNGSGGCVWQAGTHWSDGLSEAAIAQIEHRQRATFPPDYRLFLQRLHVPRPSMLCAGYLEPGIRPEDQLGILAAAYLQDYHQYMVLEEVTVFHDWLTETANSLSTQPPALWHGIQFDVEHNNLWLEEWGLRPPSAESRKQQVRELVEAAPRLVCISGNHYLLAQPCVPGNPVLSVSQANVAVRADNLRDFLLLEFAELLGLARPQIERASRAAVSARRAEYAAIPFWGALRTV